MTLSRSSIEEVLFILVYYMSYWRVFFFSDFLCTWMINENESLTKFPIVLL